LRPPPEFRLELQDLISQIRDLLGRAVRRLSWRHFENSISACFHCRKLTLDICLQFLQDLDVALHGISEHSSSDLIPARALSHILHCGGGLRKATLVIVTADKAEEASLFRTSSAFSASSAPEEQECEPSPVLQTPEREAIDP
jgi:hypothetical protein